MPSTHISGPSTLPTVQIELLGEVEVDAAAVELTDVQADDGTIVVRACPAEGLTGW